MSFDVKKIIKEDMEFRKKNLPKKYLERYSFENDLWYSGYKAGIKFAVAECQEELNTNVERLRELMRKEHPDVEYKESVICLIDEVFGKSFY